MKWILTKRSRGERLAMRLRSARGRVESSVRVRETFHPALRS